MGYHIAAEHAVFRGKIAIWFSLRGANLDDRWGAKSEYRNQKLLVATIILSVRGLKGHRWEHCETAAWQGILLSLTLAETLSITCKTRAQGSLCFNGEILCALPGTLSATK